MCRHKFTGDGVKRGSMATSPENDIPGQNILAKFKVAPNPMYRILSKLCQTFPLILSLSKFYDKKKFSPCRF